MITDIRSPRSRVRIIEDCTFRAYSATQIHRLFNKTRLGPVAKMPFGLHPQMLRHSTGFKLANQGVDTRSLQHYLGHKNIQHTVRYSELSPNRFRDFWKD
jgi:site-specific recombinase XerD